MDETKYRVVEEQLWASVGRSPSERRVRLATTGTYIRVQEVGDGEPVLFIHGGPNSGSTWAPMLEHFTTFRCVLVDRPGTGLSEPYRVTAQDLAEFGASFPGAVLDALDIDRAHVVASSLGGHLALRSAAAHPERFRRMVQMAAPALVPGQVFPPFMKLMKSGTLRKILNWLPPNERANRSILRQLGHGASLDAGLISQPFIDWYMALARYTDTMRNDGDMIGDEAMPNQDSLTLTDELLGSVSTPTLYLWGADDGFGGEDDARLVVGLMPDAEVTMMPDSGHLPWLDDPAFVATATTKFLTAADQ